MAHMRPSAVGASVLTCSRAEKSSMRRSRRIDGKASSSSAPPPVSAAYTRSRRRTVSWVKREGRGARRSSVPTSASSSSSHSLDSVGRQLWGRDTTHSVDGAPAGVRPSPGKPP
jgi:hypothetical protein